MKFLICCCPKDGFAIITFHSLEDRLVKNKFREWATACTCPPEYPVCVCGGKAKAKLITRKPIEAAAEETGGKSAQSFRQTACA